MAKQEEEPTSPTIDLEATIRKRLKNNAWWMVITDDKQQLMHIAGTVKRRLNNDRHHFDIMLTKDLFILSVRKAKMHAEQLFYAIPDLFKNTTADEMAQSSVVSVCSNPRNHNTAIELLIEITGDAAGLVWL